MVKPTLNVEVPNRAVDSFNAYVCVCVYSPFHLTVCSDRIRRSLMVIFILTRVAYTRVPVLLRYRLVATVSYARLMILR